MIGFAATVGIAVQERPFRAAPSVLRDPGFTALGQRSNRFLSHIRPLQLFSHVLVISFLADFAMFRVNMEQHTLGLPSWHP